MDDLNLTEALGQVSASEAGVIFRNFLRGGGTVRDNHAVGYEIITCFDFIG